jgi:thiol-disulfide isomerase/thioredoxin
MSGLGAGLGSGLGSVLGSGLGGGVFGSAHAAAPGSAKDALKLELAAADAEGKTLALFVQASWCPYCKLFGLLLKDPAAGPILNSHFRFFWLNVRERKPEWKARELSGAMSLFKSYSGGQQSVPFFAFLDKDGKVRSTSNDDRGENIGFPVSDAELNAFDAMFLKAAPSLSKVDVAVVRAALVRLYQPKA